MKTIGLVGGVASGKSLAAKYLVDLGAVHLDADRTGHDVLAEDTDVRQAIVDRWGDGILAADKSIDRAAIARRVFAQNKAGEADRKFLEDLLHPRIGKRLNQKRDRSGRRRQTGRRARCTAPFRSRLAKNVRRRPHDRLAA